MPAPRPTTTNEPRPKDLSPDQLGFTRRPRVPWLRPQQLAITAVRAGLAEMFGAYLDKRELQGAFPAEVYRHDSDADGDFWLDYVADLGDGFDATYSVAWLLAQRELRLGDPAGDEHTLPRGSVLVMGGDQVYPTADWRQYEDRCKGPYRAALPEQGTDPPMLYAMPGNHDWYDGLTAFLRLFGKGEPVGGWRTQQARSYFALQLPHRWWLYAIDSQFDAYLDEPQLEYFHAAAQQLTPGDRVIVCAARPTWVYSSAAPHEYDTLDYFIRRVVDPTGATVSVLLAGDAHHYARFGATDGERQLVTCGGGGAYLAATHTLPETLEVPPRKTLVRQPSPPRRYELEARYPAEKASRRFARGVFLRLPLRNPGFGTLLAVMHTLLLASYVTAGAERVPWFTVQVLGMAAVVLLAGVGFAAVDRLGVVRRRHIVAGLLHGAAHLGIGGLGAWLWSESGVAALHPLLRLTIAVAGYAPLAGVVATQLVCLYLLVVHRFGVNVNELFAGQGIEDAKSFLRLRIGSDGSLTVYAVAVDKICRAWRATPDEPAGAPWIAPEEPLQARLAEPPVPL